MNKEKAFESAVSKSKTNKLLSPQEVEAVAEKYENGGFREYKSDVVKSLQRTYNAIGITDDKLTPLNEDGLYGERTGSAKLGYILEKEYNPILSNKRQSNGFYESRPHSTKQDVFARWSKGEGIESAKQDVLQGIERKKPSEKDYSVWKTNEQPQMLDKNNSIENIYSELVDRLSKQNKSKSDIELCSSSSGDTFNMSKAQQSRANEEQSKKLQDEKAKAAKDEFKSGKGEILWAKDQQDFDSLSEQYKDSSSVVVAMIDPNEMVDGKGNPNIKIGNSYKYKDYYQRMAILEQIMQMDEYKKMQQQGKVTRDKDDYEREWDAHNFVYNNLKPVSDSLNSAAAQKGARGKNKIDEKLFEPFIQKSKDVDLDELEGIVKRQVLKPIWDYLFRKK